MADPIGTCPNCNRPVFGSERRCFCGFDLRPTIAGWQRHREELAELERERAKAAELERLAAEAAARQRQQDEAAEKERAVAAAKAEAEARRRHEEAEKERTVAAAKAEAERRHAEGQAKAEVQRHRDEADSVERAAAAVRAEAKRRHGDAAALTQAAMADEQRPAASEAGLKPTADAATHHQHDTGIGTLQTEPPTNADIRKTGQLPPEPGFWSGLPRRRLLLMAGGLAVMLLLGGLFTLQQWWDPAPPRPAGVPIATSSGMVLGRLHGLPRVDAGSPTPHAVIATGDRGLLIQHPLDALHLGPGQIVTELTPDRVGQLPRAEGPLATGFDLPGFLVSHPDAGEVEERAAQMLAAGDWALARLLLRWASESNPRAGTALGRLYDPNFTAAYRTPFQPDPNHAAGLYERAAAAGDAEARGLLDALRAQMAQRTNQPPPGTPPHPPSPRQEPEAQAGLARVTIAKGTTLGLEISRGWHRIEALQLLIAGVRAEAGGDPGLAANVPAYESRLRAERAALEQQVTAYLGTLRELQVMPPDLLQRQAQVVAADPAYAGAAMAQATDILLSLVHGMRDQTTPDRERLLRDIVQNQ